MTTAWRVALTKEETENNSDKILTVPVNVEWNILWLHVEYTSSSVVGLRQLEIQIQDYDNNVIAQWQTGIVQIEGLVYNYLFGVGVPDLLDIRDNNYLMTPMMGATFLTEGQKIHVWDNNTIDPTGDDMIVEIEHGYHDM